jgi:septal ring factor EnvC (AmiA/AmiB activator)
MTDKDEIKFAIRYLKKELKSKRTPPLYKELMNELGFVSEKELGKLEGKLADLTSEYYELENLKNNEIAELKAYNEKLLDSDIEKHNKIVELQNRNGELAGQKSSLERWLGEAKKIIKRLIKATYGEGWNYSLQVKVEAEQFLKESE